MDQLSEPEYDGGESCNEACLDRKTSERVLGDGFDRPEDGVYRVLDSVPVSGKLEGSAELVALSLSIPSALDLSNGRHFSK